MAVVGTIKHNRSRDDICDDFIPDWKWRQVNQVRTNSNKVRRVVTSYYIPTYDYMDILDRVPGWAKVIGMRLLKGLL